MLESHPAARASLEPSFQGSPNFKSHKSLPRPKDELRSIFPPSEPREARAHYINDGHLAQLSSYHRAPLESPRAAESDRGLPPTPPSNSHDKERAPNFEHTSYADAVVSSLVSKNSSLGTPVNQRSPPTPDPSPPRTSESVTLPGRPSIFTYPSSRAESFKTAREDQPSTDASNSRSNTPLGYGLVTVNEERGLGLAFERDDTNKTPTDRMKGAFREVQPDDLDRDLNLDPDLMRNVTVRRDRKPKFSPRKYKKPLDTVTATVETSPELPSSLRHRMVATESSNTPSVEDFAKAIGWPTESSSMPPDLSRHMEAKRHSGSSMTSTVVEAMVIVTPPQRQRTLRHSGKNLAYRKEGESSTEHTPTASSNRNSLNSDDASLHRLVHKRVNVSDRKRHISSEYDRMGVNRSISPLSVRRRGQEHAAYTLAHQELVRNVLEPAAMSISRSNSLSRPHTLAKSHHKRISSAPEPTRGPYTPSSLSQERSVPSHPLNSGDAVNTSTRPPDVDRTWPSASRGPSYQGSPTRATGRSRQLRTHALMDINKSLPDIPVQPDNLPLTKEDSLNQEADRSTEDPNPVIDNAIPELRENVLTPQSQYKERAEISPPRRREASGDSVPTIRRGSLSNRGYSDERRRSSGSRERTSSPRGNIPRPSLDRIPTEELPRRSHEWRAIHPEDHRRVSLDTSTSRSEEHALARHLYAQTTPFSQLSDTPFEVSEATAVSIYPHNNHSLLVVQQVTRSNTLPSEHNVDALVQASEPNAFEMASPAPLLEVNGVKAEHSDQPVLTIEPSTPPTQISLPATGAVDSPLKNPRTAPEPPVIKFIPPTPAEELERQLVSISPGPPARSNSHPQRRLSLVQRARRYSDNLISPLLARASSTRGRYVSEPQSHENRRVPTVSDEAGTLHPFWRPRGFWDGFDESDSESDGDILPEGGDTSNEPEPISNPTPSPKKLSVLGKRLTDSIKGSGGFIAGTSVRNGPARTSKRPAQAMLPFRPKPKAPKILIQRPTFPIGERSPRIEKRSSQASIQSYKASNRPRRVRRESWRKGKKLPGVGLQIQYIGISGVKERFRERRAEKRRQEIRRSIGSRYYVEGGMKTV